MAFRLKHSDKTQMYYSNGGGRVFFLFFAAGRTNVSCSSRPETPVTPEAPWMR